MKRLSDYTGADAIDLWADILEPVGRILADDEIKKQYEKKEPKIKLIKQVLKTHKDDVIEILTAIDDTPVDALNIVTRFSSLLVDIGKSEEFASFFASAEQVKTDSASFGSAMVSTEAGEN